jgi:hypothetical protein
MSVNRRVIVDDDDDEEREKRCETYVAWFPSLVVLNRQRKSDKCGPETDQRIFLSGARHEGGEGDHVT